MQEQDKSIYTHDTGRGKEQEFTISVLSENKIGLLQQITILFTRRRINIESLNTSESELEGVYRYTIVVHTTRSQIEKLLKQIQKLIEVLGAFVYTEDQIHYQEIALYKVPADAFSNGNHIEKLVRNNGARILGIEEKYIVIEKTGHKDETKAMLELLKPFGVLEFVRSGRVAISKSSLRTSVFLQELELISRIPKDVNMKYLKVSDAEIQ